MTIGIPAYNEARNIGVLLKAILGQKLDDELSLSQILVVSDGSTDATAHIVSEWMKQDSRIELYELTKRSGKPTAINKIFELAHGDVIVLLDADTMPVGDKFLSGIVNLFKYDSKVGIIAAVGIPLPSNNLVGRAAVFSSNVRRRLIRARPYLAFNIAIAIVAKTAKTITLPHWIIGDDAFLYFRTQSQGLKCIISRSAKILYREPQTLRDFIVQRKKYDKNVVQLCQFFGDSAKEQVRIPRRLWLVFLREMLCDPVGGFVWLLLRGVLKLRGSMGGNEVVMGFSQSTKEALSPSIEN